MGQHMASGDSERILLTNRLFAPAYNHSKYTCIHGVGKAGTLFRLRKKKQTIALRIKILASIFSSSCNTGPWNQWDDLSFIIKLELNFKTVFLRHFGCICGRKLRD